VKTPWEEKYVETFVFAKVAEKKEEKHKEFNFWCKKIT
jgi:hypothetical protein